MVTTCLDPEEAADCLSSMRDADRKAADIANTIVRLKNDLNDLQQLRVRIRRFGYNRFRKKKKKKN